jgi:hypothetical protein
LRSYPNKFDHFPVFFPVFQKNSRVSGGALTALVEFAVKSHREHIK